MGPVVNNTSSSRFEIEAQGQLAQLVYRHRGKRLVLVHTEVPEALEGQGVGGLLVEASLDFGAQNMLTVVPLCPFALSWLKRHPESASRVTIDWPTETGR